jgi:soluble lytic murein transglycosylase-like protein
MGLWVRKNESPAGQAVASWAGLFRMFLVVFASLATLVSLPSWLRHFEQSPRIALHSQKLKDSAPPRVADTSTTVDPLPVERAESAHHQVLAQFLSKRYRVSSEALERFIQLAYSAGQMTKLDPLLILAVMAVESSFNPVAESEMGAKGLMQVIPHYHQDKLRTAHGRELNVLDPETNILVGAKVLREYASRTGNNLAAALGLYVGAGPDPSTPYASKVLSERHRLEQLLSRIHRSRIGRAPSLPQEI